MLAKFLNLWENNSPSSFQRESFGVNLVEGER